MEDISSLTLLLTERGPFSSPILLCCISTLLFLFFSDCTFFRCFSPPSLPSPLPFLSYIFFPFLLFFFGRTNIHSTHSKFLTAEMDGMSLIRLAERSEGLLMMSVNECVCKYVKYEYIKIYKFHCCGFSYVSVIVDLRLVDRCTRFLQEIVVIKERM